MPDNQSPVTPHEPDSGLDRRTFLRLLGAGTLASLGPGLPLMADSLDDPAFDHIIPGDKKFKEEWVRSLFERGMPEVYRGGQLSRIAMPIGGICIGQDTDLSGDGTMIGWRVHGYLLRIVQGFSLRVATGGAGGGTKSYPLTQNGFPGMTFRGEYPIAKLEYANPAIPVAASLEAFTPFVPLETDDSSLPASVFNFTLKNTSAAPAEATIGGSLENGVCGFHRFSVAATRRNEIVRGDGVTVMNCTATPAPANAAANRPDIVFEDWTKPAYTGWKAEGTAFGTGPVGNEWPFEGDQFVNLRYANSFAPTKTETATGKLTSDPFTIQRNFIKFYLSGGTFEGKTCINLLVDGEAPQSLMGSGDNQLVNYFFDTHGLEGKQARIEIVDQATENTFERGVAHITVGPIVFSDVSHDGTPLPELPDFGTMAMALLGAPAEVGIAKGEIGFGGDASADASAKLAEKLIGTLGRTVRLGPGESATAAFVVTWHFPNLEMVKLGKVGRYYANKFKSARDVAEYVAANHGRLTDSTRLWRDTWYDSTLPYWFLDRTFLNVSTLATSVCYRFANGQFYGYEGGPAPNYVGTCTHVWQYAQSVARIFPALERDTRERMDLGLALNPETGEIGARGQYGKGMATDGQAGTILRFYREHQMAPDDSFLKRNWEKIKLTYKPLFAMDPKGEGILRGAQGNTLDLIWFGQISWISSLYAAAVRAGELMAREVGDTVFAEQCARIADNGSRNITARLYNGEYYNSIPATPEWVNSGDGSHIDQVYGQGWAFYIGLPRVLPERETRTALQSIWKYNFCTDLFAYRKTREPGRRFYSPGDAGMLMCTFPRKDWDYERAKGTNQYGWNFAGYFNESWTGQEYQIASHMLWEGMPLEGMAITRAVHERYSPDKRNPWAEEEAGIHYSRAMASHAVFLAACGYEYHGPKGHLGFAPKIRPENFRAAFTAAEGWGSYSQSISGGKMRASVEVKRGGLKLMTMSLAMKGVGGSPKVTAEVGGREVPVSARVEGEHVMLAFGDQLGITAGGKLSIQIDAAG